MEGNPSRVELPALLTVAHVRELHDRLSASASVGGPIEVLGRQLERIDAAGLQLLVAWSREVHAQGGTITWDVADVLITAADAVGLARELGLPSVDGR